MDHHYSLFCPILDFYSWCEFHPSKSYFLNWNQLTKWSLSNLVSTPIGKLEKILKFNVLLEMITLFYTMMFYTQNASMLKISDFLAHLVFDMNFFNLKKSQ